MYQIQLYNYNYSPLSDGLIRFFTDDLDTFEKYWIPLEREENEDERIDRFLKSKAGKIVTDYYSKDPKLNIVQEKEVEVIAEKTFTEEDVTKTIFNAYGYPSLYHMGNVTYNIRYIFNASDNEFLKLCRYEIKGICYDKKTSYWTGKTDEVVAKYKKIGFENCKHLADKDFLPAYHFYKDGEFVATYHPRYQHVTVFGNPFIDLKTKRLYSDNLEDFEDTKANLYIWHIVKEFEDKEALMNNLKHYKLGKEETQRLFADLPGEAG